MLSTFDIIITCLYGVWARGRALQSFVGRMFQLLQEEMNSQQPQYEQFIQCSLSILEKCDPASSDAQHINKHLDEINKSWDKVQGRLEEREATLKDTLAVSTQYYDVLQELTEWLPTMQEKMESLPVISTQADMVAEQKSQLKELSDDVEGQRPQVEKAAALCKQLVDSTKEGSIKFDLKNKLTNVEKPYNEICKKLGGWLEG